MDILQEIHYLDDFTVKIPAMKHEGKIVPFEMTLKTATREYNASFMDGVAINLETAPTDASDYIVVKVDKGMLDVGELTYEAIHYVPSDAWRSGYIRKGAGGSTGLKLVSQKPLDYAPELPIEIPFDTTYLLIKWTEADFNKTEVHDLILEAIDNVTNIGAAAEHKGVTAANQGNQAQIDGVYAKNQGDYAKAQANAAQLFLNDLTAANLIERLNTVSNQLTDITTGDTSAIDSYNEMVAVMSGLEDTETIKGIFDGFTAQLATKANRDDVYTKGEINGKLLEYSTKVEMAQKVDKDELFQHVDSNAPNVSPIVKGAILKTTPSGGENNSIYIATGSLSNADWNQIGEHYEYVSPRFNSTTLREDEVGVDANDRTFQIQLISSLSAYGWLEIKDPQTGYYFRLESDNYGGRFRWNTSTHSSVDYLDTTCLSLIVTISKGVIYVYERGRLTHSIDGIGDLKNVTIKRDLLTCALYRELDLFVYGESLRFLFNGGLYKHRLNHKLFTDIADYDLLTFGKSADVWLKQTKSSRTFRNSLMGSERVDKYDCTWGALNPDGSVRLTRKSTNYCIDNGLANSSTFLKFYNFSLYRGQVFKLTYKSDSDMSLFGETIPASPLEYNTVKINAISSLEYSTDLTTLDPSNEHFIDIKEFILVTVHCADEFRCDTITKNIWANTGVNRATMPAVKLLKTNGDILVFTVTTPPLPLYVSGSGAPSKSSNAVNQVYDDYANTVRYVPIYRGETIGLNWTPLNS